MMGFDRDATASGERYLTTVLGAMELLLGRLLKLEQTERSPPDPRATDVEVANTAIALNDLCGIELPDGTRRCDLEGYAITRHGDRYVARDRQGSPVLQFATAIAPNGDRIPTIAHSQLTERQRLDWLAAGRSITRGDLKILMRTNSPQAQLDRLGNLAPAGTRDRVERQWQAVIAATAWQVVQTAGRATDRGRQFDGRHYRIETSGRDLTITAKDGRGTVLHYDLPARQAKQSHLTLADYRQFQEIARLIAESLDGSHQRQVQRDRERER